MAAIAAMHSPLLSGEDSRILAVILAPGSVHMYKYMTGAHAMHV